MHKSSISVHTLMMNTDYLLIYKRAMRDYYRLADDFMNHRHLSLNQIKQHYQNRGEDHHYVFIIRYGTIVAYLTHYYADFPYSSQDRTYSLSHHITIYVMENKQIREFDSLSIQRLKKKIYYLQKAKR